jgi:death-on-curing protein
VSDWRWLSAKLARAAHDLQIRAHGGGEGTRADNLLEGALARPMNLAVYGEPDAADLAAAYAFGIARNHPFVDGNKRTALVVSETFLNLNGFALDASDAELVVLFEDLAARKVSEEQLAGWQRERLAADA